MAKKMKRLSLIVKGEGIVASLLGIRENKIKRAVESAGDYAEEQILDANAAKLKALEALGKGADSSDSCRSAINAYCDACEAIDAWSKKAEYIAQLKADLESEVPTDEE